jgi:hypothetical protein
MSLTKSVSNQRPKVGFLLIPANSNTGITHNQLRLRLRRAVDFLSPDFSDPDYVTRSGMVSSRYADVLCLNFTRASEGLKQRPA